MLWGSFKYHFIEIRRAISSCHIIFSPLPSRISIMPDLMILHGRVISGRGTYSKRPPPPPLIKFFGKHPERGTLNLALDEPIRFNPVLVELMLGENAFFWACEIGGMRCLVARAKGHPLHIIEIIAPCRLRDMFQLNDGDNLELQVSGGILEDLSISTRVVWAIFWRFRETWYASRTYRLLIGPFWLIRRRATQAPVYRAKLL